MMATARILVSLFSVFVVFFIFKKIMIKKFTIAFKNNFVKALMQEMEPSLERQFLHLIQ
jgi:succinate dehydrogenase hydrophobic anchor subunit